MLAPIASFLFLLFLPGDVWLRGRPASVSASSRETVSVFRQRNELRITKATMKTKLLSLSFFLAALAVTDAKITAFMYQGRLDDGGSPANGTYDFIYHSTNSGVDWTDNPAPTFNTIPRSWHSVASSADGSKFFLSDAEGTFFFQPTPAPISTSDRSRWKLTATRQSVIEGVREFDLRLARNP